MSKTTVQPEARQQPQYEQHQADEDDTTLTTLH